MSEAEQFNTRLKQVTNMDEFQSLKAEAGKEGLYLYGKRRGYSAFDFTQSPYDKNRTMYLYDDGESRGESNYKDLHRALKFR